MTNCTGSRKGVQKRRKRRSRRGGRRKEGTAMPGERTGREREEQRAGVVQEEYKLRARWTKSKRLEGRRARSWSLEGS